MRHPRSRVPAAAVALSALVLSTAAALAPTSALAATPGTLSTGDRLGPNQAVTSPTGATRLVMQGDGNLVEYTDRGVVVWSSGTSGRGASTLVLQGDGNLVVYTAAGVPTWSTGTRDARTLSVQDDGNIVLYSASRASWCTCALPFGRMTGSPSTMPVGWGLLAGDSLKSADRQLVLQNDGNLVLYGPSGAVWSTATSGAGNRLVFQGDGNLVVYRGDGRPLWSSGTSNIGVKTLQVSADYGVQLIASLGRTVWTAGASSPAGIAADVFALLNRQRTANGLPALTSDPRLVAAAAAHNAAMSAASQLEHQVPGELAPSARISATGYVWRAWAENVAMTRDATSAGAQTLQTTLFNEQPPDDTHRQNILWDAVTQVGVAVLVDGKGRLWLTTDFAAPM